MRFLWSLWESLFGGCRVFDCTGIGAANVYLAFDRSDCFPVRPGSTPASLASLCIAGRFGRGRGN